MKDNFTLHDSFTRGSTRNAQRGNVGVPWDCSQLQHTVIVACHTLQCAWSSGYRARVSSHPEFTKIPLGKHQVSIAHQVSGCCRCPGPGHCASAAALSNSVLSRSIATVLLITQAPATAASMGCRGAACRARISPLRTPAQGNGCQHDPVYTCQYGTLPPGTLADAIDNESHEQMCPGSAVRRATSDVSGCPAITIKHSKERSLHSATAGTCKRNLDVYVVYP